MSLGLRTQAVLSHLRDQRDWKQAKRVLARHFPNASATAPSGKFAAAERARYVWLTSCLEHAQRKEVAKLQASLARVPAADTLKEVSGWVRAVLEQRLPKPFVDRLAEEGEVDAKDEAEDDADDDVAAADEAADEAAAGPEAVDGSVHVAAVRGPASRGSRSLGGPPPPSQPPRTVAPPAAAPPPAAPPPAAPPPAAPPPKQKA